MHSNETNTVTVNDRAGGRKQPLAPRDSLIIQKLYDLPLSKFTPFQTRNAPFGFILEALPKPKNNYEYA